MPASFPGSCAGEEEREPGTHCSRMRQTPLVTCILLRYTYLLKDCTAWIIILPVGYTWVVLSERQYCFDGNDLHCFNCSRQSLNIKGEDCISDVLQCLAGMDECIRSSCKWRADYVCHSLSIVYTECGQWQAFLYGRSRVALRKLV